MFEVRQTVVFADWFAELRDVRGKAAILSRIDRLAIGNPGDVRPVGDGISELRIDFGPGYRVYYAKIGSEFVVLLCGGAKGSQARDIARAKKLASAARDAP